MRGKVAKKIRKTVYGDQSLRNTKYTELVTRPYGRVTRACVGLRSKYREVKKEIRG